MRGLTFWFIDDNRGFTVKHPCDRYGWIPHNLLTEGCPVPKSVTSYEVMLRSGDVCCIGHGQEMHPIHWHWEDPSPRDAIAWRPIVQ